MQEAAVSPLTAWLNFYIIIGSSAGALTGLMFVVITLIAGTRDRKAGGAVAAFATPTVVHFCLVLLVAAIFSAPWQALWNASLLLGLLGLGGMIYVVIVIRRTGRQTSYQPVLEDWLSHGILPLISYTAFAVAAILLPGNPTPALFVTGAAAVLLLFIGIHNAWDTITYVAVQLFQQDNKSQD